MDVSGEAGDGHEAVDKTEQLTPDVVVLDVAMPDMNGFQAAREISRHHRDLPLLLVTVQQPSSQLTSEAERWIPGRPFEEHRAARSSMP